MFCQWHIQQKFFFSFEIVTLFSCPKSHFFNRPDLSRNFNHVPFEALIGTCLQQISLAWACQQDQTHSPWGISEWINKVGLVVEKRPSISPPAVDSPFIRTLNQLGAPQSLSSQICSLLFFQICNNAFCRTAQAWQGPVNICVSCIRPYYVAFLLPLSEKWDNWAIN